MSIELIRALLAGATAYLLMFGAGGLWKARRISDDWLNYWSFVCGALQALAITATIAILAYWRLPTWWATWFGLSLGSIAGIAYFIDGCANPPIPVGFGAAGTFLDTLVDREFRNGRFFRSHLPWFGMGMIDDLTDHTSEPEHYEVVAPDGNKMTGWFRIITYTDSVYRHQPRIRGERAELDELIARTGKFARDAIQHPVDMGTTAMEVSHFRAHISSHAEREIRPAAYRLGQHVEVMHEQSLPPDAIMDAHAAQTAVPLLAGAQAEAKDIGADRLHGRIDRFRNADPADVLSRRDAANLVQSEGGTATRSIHELQDADSIARTVVEAIKALFTPRTGAI